MISFWRLLISLGVSISLVACVTVPTTVHTTYPSGPEVQAALGRQDLRPGDELLVTMSDGPTYRLTLTDVDETTIQGFVWGSGRHVSLARNRITRIDRDKTDESIDWKQSTINTLGVLLVVGSLGVYVVYNIRKEEDAGHYHSG